MRVRFLRTARVELRQIFDYYEGEREGLGTEFAVAVSSAVDDIVDLPQAWTKLSKHVRRRNTGRFPYGVFYREGQGEITILAVIHLHRDPAAWEHLLE